MTPVPTPVPLSSVDSSRAVINLPMTVADARQVIWPFKGLYRQMGELLDADLIRLKDLAWAITDVQDDSNYPNNPRIRAAALTLLATRLGSANLLSSETPLPARDLHGPTVIAGSRYLADQMLLHYTYLLAYIAAGFFGALWFLQSLVADTARTPLPILFIGTTVYVIVFIVLFRHIRRHGRLYRTFEAGLQGEDAVVDRLRGALDGRWTILRNVQLSNRQADLDVVLVGPSGVWLLEVKALNGTVRVQEQDRWQRLGSNGQWITMQENPSKQAQRNAVHLRDFLQRKGINVRWVEAVVILSKGQPIENFTTATPSVWLLDNLAEQVTRLPVATTHRYIDQERIVAALRDEVILRRGAEASTEGPEGWLEKLIRFIIFGRRSFSAEG